MVQSTPHVGTVEGSYNRVTRAIFRQQGAVEAYGGWLYLGGHHFIEDVGGVGFLNSPKMRMNLAPKGVIKLSTPSWG
jgi:hypothetical protein